ncbi:maestro heat-like repeat-containing protein family member 2B [Mergus octosetaceus]
MVSAGGEEACEEEQEEEEEEEVEKEAEVQWAGGEKGHRSLVQMPGAQHLPVPSRSLASQGLLHAGVVLEQWSRAINAYFNAWQQCPFPRIGEAQLCEQVYGLFCHAVGNWLGREEEEEDKQAVLGAVAAMMAVVLRDAQHQDNVWKQVFWLLQQYQELQETCRVTESLCYFLTTLEELHAVAPQDKLRAIAAAVHHQIMAEARQPSAGHKEELRQCIVLQARICPEETITFLLSQLSSEDAGTRRTALTLLGAVARTDEPAVREKLPLIVEAVQPLFVEAGTQVRSALLGFIRDLLSVSIPSCLAWEAVAHIFVEFRRASDRLAVEDLQEERDLRAQCIDVLESLDVSVGGMTQLLWPRLLQYMVPAQYCGLLLPLSRCLQAVIERQKQTEGQEDTEKPDAAQGQDKTPTPQALLVQLLVVAASAGCREGGAAALQLLQALQSRIHRSLRDLWPMRIPCMLQYLEEHPEGSLDSEEWQCYLLKFLMESAEEMQEDQPWIVCLSQELSQQLSSSSSSEEDKKFLYRALGTVLASCRQLTHVQGQLLKYLKETDATRPCDKQGIASVVSYAAERHFYLALDAMHTFNKALIKFGRRPRKAEGQEPCELWLALPLAWGPRLPDRERRNQATRAAVMLTYGKIALRAPKAELLDCVENCILANILELFRACRTQELQHKLALVHSIQEVTRAIQAVDTKQSFRLCKKPEVLKVLLLLGPGALALGGSVVAVGMKGLDLMKEDGCDSPVSRLHLKVLRLLEQLSKLEPRMGWKKRRSQVAVCCRRVLSCPPADTELQPLQTSCEEALGQLMSAFLQAEGTSRAFADMVSVLLSQFTSREAWQQERALQLCAQLLGTYEELFKCSRKLACSGFGSLLGVLGPLLSDSQATSRQRAGACLSCLLRIQACGLARASRVVLQVPDIKELCERLDTMEDGPLREDRAEIAKDVCQYLPQRQARSFMNSIMKTFLCTNQERARAAGDWLIAFLETRGNEIYPEVPKFMKILWEARHTVQQSPLKDLLFKAICLLAGFHIQPVADTLLQTESPSERDVVRLWRSLGSSDLGPKVLCHLILRLNEASEARRRLTVAAQPLDPLKLLCAISEVMSALLTTEEARAMLLCLFFALLKWVSIELGTLVLFPPLSLPSEIFKETEEEELVCGHYSAALEQVLRRFLDERWQRVLWNHRVWPSLDVPQWHCNAVQLLTRVLLRAQLVSRWLINSFSLWLHSSSQNLQLTALAFFAELMKDPPAEGKDLLKPLVWGFLEKLKCPSRAVKQMAARGLGSAVSGLPKKFQRHKRNIVEALGREMEKVDCPGVAAESMLALAEIFAKQTVKGSDKAFKSIARSTRKFFDAEQEDLRFAAFRLYAALAAGAKGNLTTFFRAEVEQTLGSLFLHLQDPSCAKGSLRSCLPGTGEGTTEHNALFQACRTALYGCAPFVEPKGLQVVVMKSIGCSGAELQSDVYSYLETHAPELLKKLKHQQESPQETRLTDATLHVLDASLEHKESTTHAEDIPEHAEDLSGDADDLPELEELMTRTTQPVSVHTTCEHSTKMKTDRRDRGGWDQEQGPGLAAQLPPARLRLAAVRQPLSALPEETVTWPLGGGYGRYVGVTAFQNHMREIVEALGREMEKVDYPEVAVESTLALAEILAKLMANGLGEAFRSIGCFSRKFFDTVIQACGLTRTGRVVLQVPDFTELCERLETMADGAPWIRTSRRRPRNGGRETGSETLATSATVVTSLLKKLQDREGERAETYRRLEHVLQGDDTRLRSGVVNRVLAEVSGDTKAAQGAVTEVTAAAGDVLVALARSHFEFVMSELQGHLKSMRGGACQEFVLSTLSKLASSYALRCIPFAQMTLAALHAVLSHVESSRILRAICSGE